MPHAPVRLAGVAASVATGLILAACTTPGSTPVVATTASSSHPTTSPTTTGSPSRPTTPLGTGTTTATASSAPAKAIEWNATRQGEATRYSATLPGGRVLFPVPFQVASASSERDDTWYVRDLDGGSLLVLRVDQPGGASIAAENGQLVVTATAGPAVLSATDNLIASASWIGRAGERPLAIRPTWAARAAASQTAGDAVWAQVLTRVPEADLPGMRDQLVCHVQFASEKKSWYLEPARPDVGYAATVAAGCNPGDTADPDLP